MTVPPGILVAAPSAADALMERARTLVVDGTIMVPTDVLLPDNSTVVLEIEGGTDGRVAVVSDAGLAARFVSEHGLELTVEAAAAIRRVARSWGLALPPRPEGRAPARWVTLRSRPTVIGDLPAAVRQVANATREAAVAALTSARAARTRDVVAQVDAALLRLFDKAQIRHEAPLPGESDARHKFDWLIALHGGGDLALDLAMPQFSSLASAVVRHLDVRLKAEATGQRLRQVIAYDDSQRWQAEQLHQLHLPGVPVVQASAVQRELAEIMG